MLPMVVARSAFCGVAICYILPSLWMTSYLHINLARISDATKAYTQSDSKGGGRI